MKRAATPLLLCTIQACAMVSPSAPATDPSGIRTPVVLAAGGDQRIVPPSFFGMHVVGLGAHQSWPTVPFGLYRFMDATPRWHVLQNGPDNWANDETKGTGLARLRYILDERDRRAPQVSALYTLAGGANGGFPEWLRYATSPADTLHAWQQHVRKLGTMFRGRIRYWEIWNEFDCTCFYRGGNTLLVQLTRIARDELKAIDPENVIIAPAITSKGVERLNGYLKAGGGQYVDAIAWHPDLPSRPETDTAVIRRIHGVLADHKLGHLPLWATEGHTAAEKGVDPAALVVRTYIVLWSTGHANFSWYAWDIADYGDSGDWITLTKRGQPDQPSPAAAGYRAAYDWLVGHRVVDLDVDGDTWIASVARSDGRAAWIVWAAGPDARPFTVPSVVRTLQRIDGSSTSVVPAHAYLPTSSPVLLISD